MDFPDRSLNDTSLFSSDIDDALLRALCFFDVLHYPLTVEELCERLPAGRKVHADEVRAAVARLAHEGRITQDGSLIALSSSRHLFRRRRDGEGAHADAMRRVWRWTWIFRWIPFVEEVYLCNSLTLAQADRESDIDVFVVMRRGRMFLGRVFLLLIFHILGLRRHGAHVAGRWCFSFLVDSSVRDLSRFLLSERDVYFAYWTQSLVPIFLANRGGEYGEREIDGDLLCAQREWLMRIFGLSVCKKSCDVFGRSWKRRIREWVFSGRIGDACERLCERWQMRRALKKWEQLGRPSGVLLEKHVLKFHDRDRREAFSRDFFKRYACVARSL